MTTIIQRSFGSGELDPALHARTDFNKYQNGLKTCLNTTVKKSGGTQNRAGTEFCEPTTKLSVGEVTRLIPFDFNGDETYQILSHGLFFYFIKNGKYIMEPTARTILGATKTNFTVLTLSSGHGLQSFELIYISGVVGMTELNNKYYRTASSGPTSIALQSIDGVPIDSTLYSTFTSGGSIFKPLRLQHIYGGTEIPDVQFVQSGDVITLTHPNHPPQELKRITDTNWTFDFSYFKPQIEPPIGLANAGPAGSTAPEPTYNITNISSATPAVVTTSVAHGYITGDQVHISAAIFFFQSSGYTMNPEEFKITNLATTTFSLKRLDGTNKTFPGTYASGGKVTRTGASTGVDYWLVEWAVTSISSSNEESIISGSTGGSTVPSSGAPVTLTWTPVVGAAGYNVYKKKNGIFGFIGYTQSANFSDDGIIPDVTATVATPEYPFALGQNNDWPAVVAYFQQRLMFGRTNAQPETIFGSRAGQYKNFLKTFPLNERDAIEFTIVSKKVSEIRHMIDLGTLIIFTSNGEWTLEPPISPTSINLKPHSYNGSSKLFPLIVDSNPLYVQAKSSIIRDLGFDYQVDGYRGNDITVSAQHLFRNKNIVDWAFQQTPDSIVWIVLDDGALIGLTYVREQQMIAWHRHDLAGGKARNVCSISENNRDALYLVVERTVGGFQRRYVERLSPREIDEPIIMDAHLSYNGTNLTTSHTMKLTSAATYTYQDELTLTSSTSFFTAADVGNAVHFTSADDVLRCVITSYTSGTVVKCYAHKDVPIELQNLASSNWGKAVDEIIGLQHLEGLDVSITGDGHVLASPNNPAFNKPYTVGATTYDRPRVVNGSVTLDKPYVKISVGLPYISDIQTLDIDQTGNLTMADKAILINNVTLHLQGTRGLFVGGRAPVSSVLDGLVEFKGRSNENTYDEPTALINGKREINIISNYSKTGSVFIRQVDPLPCSILSVAPGGLFPFGGG